MGTINTQNLLYEFLNSCSEDLIIKERERKIGIDYWKKYYLHIIDHEDSKIEKRNKKIDSILDEL